MNNKGQFSIIAALLVAVVLIGAVITTYSTIRYSTVEDQPQILSAVDETNLGLKQILGFTVGYYGSVIKVTGNASYALQLATNYFQSGIRNIGEMRPEWGASFNVTSLDIGTNWFSEESYSQGSMHVNYDLTGLGISGISFSASAKLDVQISEANSTSQAQLTVLKEDNEPLIDLGKTNFNFYRYDYQDSSWKLMGPTNIVSYTDGTYVIDVPSGVLGAYYVIQVEDTRGIMVVASSFSRLTSTFAWNNAAEIADYIDLASLNVTGSHGDFEKQKLRDANNDVLTEANTRLPNDVNDYVDLTSNVDGSSDKGTHSNFNLQQAKDNNFDTLTEANTAQTATEILRPSGTGTSTALSRSSGYYNWACVDDVSSDGDSSYVYTTSTSTTLDSYATQDHTAGSGAITSVTVHIVAREQSYSTGYARTVIRTHGNNYQSSDFSLTSSYSEYTKTYATNPYTNLAWTWAEIDALECGVALRASYYAYSRCTQVWIEVNYSPPPNYQLDLEEQFTNVDRSRDAEFLCVYPGTFSSENLMVQVWTGSGWTTVIPVLQPSQWNNVSVSSYLTSSTFTIRFVGTSESSDTTQSTWPIDAVLLHIFDFSNYQINLEEQFTDVDYNKDIAKLCVYAGTRSDSESLRVDVNGGSGWTTVIPVLQPSQWNNVSVSSYLTSSTFTIRFVGTSESSDTTQSTWQIDAVLLQLSSFSSSLPKEDSKTVIEWLQNGTMRWLGQNIQFTTQALPIPPISVKAFHINETINDVNQQVPFQIEDWASNYQIPLGLSSNTTVFSNRQMIVFILNNKVTEFTLWWDGSDTAVQTPLGYINTCFDDSTTSLNNGKLSLSVSSSFVVTSQVVGKSTSSVATFMRINNEASTYGAGSAYVIYNGTVRDIIQQEAEWSTGPVNCPNVYANIVLTLPANVSYYTYQERLMFISSAQSRTISALCPIRISTNVGSVQAQTENGTLSGFPIIQDGTGTFDNYTIGGCTAHHGSQLISATGQGTGIMFTDNDNQKLYAFDVIAGSSSRGALRTSSGLIELLPVSSAQVSFTYPLEITWNGAVATFDGTTPIFATSGGGLWILAEYPPVLTITAER